MGFWIQYRALMFKNWILWKRKILGSLCEIILPIGAMIIIGLLRTSVPPEKKDSQTFNDQIDDSKYLTNDSRDFPFVKCLYNDIDQPYGYSIISKDSDYVDYMKNKVDETISRIIEGINFQHVEFESISDFEDYITSSNYDDNVKICFGVYMKNTEDSKYEVRIRYNITQPITRDGDRLGEFINIFNLGVRVLGC